jgi:hypothetical protein
MGELAYRVRRVRYHGGHQLGVSVEPLSATAGTLPRTVGIVGFGWEARRDEPAREGTLHLYVEPGTQCCRCGVQE